jgi:NitT/TauT family transport system permease protein
MPRDAGTSPVRYHVPAVVTGALLLTAWELGPPLFGISPLLIPRMSVVAASLWDQLQRGLILGNLLVTLGEALGGFVLGSGSGILIAALVSRSALLERAVLPYMVALQSLPKVALAPLLVVWLGFGLGSKVAIAAIIAFFPVLINSLIGFSTVEREKLELMRSLVATEWQTFRMLRFPNALPFIFGGLNVAIVFSITGALVGEFVGAREGLGMLLLQFNFNMDIGGMFAVLIVLGLMGATLHGLVRTLHRRLIFWAQPDDLERRAP